MMFAADDSGGFEIVFMADDWDKAMETARRNGFQRLGRYICAYPALKNKLGLRIVK